MCPPCAGEGCGTQEPGSQSWSSAKPGPHPEPWAPAGSDLPQPSPPAARGLESQASSQACVRPLPQRPNGWGSQKAQEHSGGTEVKPATVHEGRTGHRLRHLRVSQLPKAGPMGGRPGVSRTGKPPGWEGGSCSSQEPRGAHWERPLGSNLEVCACSPKALDSHGKLQSSGGLEQRGERSGSCGCTAQPGRNLGALCTGPCWICRFLGEKKLSQCLLCSLRSNKTLAGICVHR